MGRTGTKCALDIVGVPHIFSATKAYIYIYIMWTSGTIAWHHI